MLLLAAAGAALVHQVLGQNLADLSAQNAESNVRYLALKTVQRILFPISMLLGVVAGRAMLDHEGTRSACSTSPCRC